MATKQQISDAVYNAWTADPPAAGLGVPLRPAMIRALTDAVADGILAHTGSGGQALQPTWYEHELLAGQAGVDFTLPKTPVPGSLSLLINGVRLKAAAYTLVGKDGTLAESKPAAYDLTAHYQSWE